MILGQICQTNADQCACMGEQTMQTIPAFRSPVLEVVRKPGLRVARNAHACATIPRALVAGALFGALLAACGTTTQRPATVAAPASQEPGTWKQRGLASYYASSLAGNRTASGEPYRPSQLTAAHRKLPFGTWVRVRRIDGAGVPFGPAVEVRVNDRGPYGGGRRIIDLSMAAARALGIVREGVVPVEIEVLRGR